MGKALRLPGAAVLAGIVGLLVRWAYLQYGFEVGTDLPLSGAPTMWLMLLVTLAAAAVLALLCRGSHRQFHQCYTGAFSSGRLVWNAGALAGAVLLVVGGFLALLTWVNSPLDTVNQQRTVSIAWALLGILALLAGAGIYFLQVQMRRGRPVLTGWTALPGFACCLWIMANYYTYWAAEPSLGRYGIPLLAVALSLLACMEMGALAFGKVKTGRLLFLCLAAGAFNLMALADGLPLADTALYLGMTLYLLSSAGVLAENDAKPAGLPPCADHCPQCAGCAPMGTMKEPEKKKKGKAAQS